LHFYYNTRNAQIRILRVAVQVRRPTRRLLHLRCQFGMSIFSSFMFPNITLHISHTNSVSGLPNFTMIHPRCALFERLLKHNLTQNVHSFIGKQFGLINMPSLDPVVYQEPPSKIYLCMQECALIPLHTS
jgi:hypothetical protein